MAAAGKEMQRFAVLIIDLQQSFTIGHWMQHFGETDGTYLKTVFSKIPDCLQRLPQEVPLLISQCPFSNPRDFKLVPAVQQVLDSRQHTRVIKPGNSILMAPGAIEWMEEILTNGVRNLVIGGCTANSCVRVSALHLAKYFGPKGLNVHVDLSLCGARDSNYIKRCSKCLDNYMVDSSIPLCGKCSEEGGVLKSPVDLAVDEMKGSGINVYENFDWSLLESDAKDTSSD